MKPIIVIGDLNMDFVVQTPKLPVRGETIMGTNFRMVPGGKGANQAVAAGKLGKRVKMIGRVGKDIFGENLITGLSSVGVDTQLVLSTPEISTGIALILVEDGGQNQITVTPGANDALQPNDFKELFQEYQEGYLLTQLGLPLKTVEEAISLAKDTGMTTILDPAPASTLNPSLLNSVDILTPNESEALILLGQQSGEITLEQAASMSQDLLSLGPSCVILKMGRKGAWLTSQKECRHFPAHPVEAIDVTAAGDTFNGALAVGLSEKQTLEESILFANAAAAISVTSLGAQDSIPSRGEVNSFLNKVSHSINRFNK